MSLQSIGKKGETYAKNYLLSLGYSIREQNYRTRLGEIDIIAKKENTIYFCEVKTRIGEGSGKPYEAVTYRKLQHIKRVAQAYLLQNNIKNSKLSVQVISIILLSSLAVKELKMYEVI
ncbi:MAG: YraN family protein [bacterium]